MIPGCGICYQELHPIDHPACYLPCGHIFCLQCGGRLVSKYPCPFKCTLNSRTRTVRQRDVRSLAISVVPIEGVDEERAVLGAIVAADAKHRATDASACQLAEQNRVQDQRYQVQLSQLSRLGTYVIDSSEKLKGTLLTTRRAYETLRKHDCLRRQLEQLMNLRLASPQRDRSKGSTSKTPEREGRASPASSRCPLWLLMKMVDAGNREDRWLKYRLE
ncbi:hypothetical protein FA13DRAFT_1715939 [Coprinellus micaceus]|uniref:RING-type domain-containing protein n=1 Tax=Coprinellus micaceus TaxID=71717 RepID=A0A4Y7SMZ3_COPMI|nr:hypothetical protein FA13DRAFT_1715939 [Coprinellus micaceus]